MRIAFFTETFPAYSETFITNQVIESLRLGHHIDIYPINGRSHADRIHDFIPSADLRERVRIYYPTQTAASRTIARASMKAPALLSLIREYGITNMRQVIQHIADHNPARYDIIHGHFGPSARRAALLGRLAYLQGPLISTFHGFDVHTIPRKLPLSYYNIVFEDSAAITVGSRFMREKLVWMGAPHDKVHLLPMPINLENFPYRAPTMDRSTIRFLSVGRLIDWKGHRFAIEALHKIRKELPAWHYDIIGDGRERKHLEELIHHDDLADHITLLGSLPNHEVAAQMAKHDILIHPSIQGRQGSVESQGVVLGEAAAVGLPIVATRSGGIPDTVIDGKNGFLADSNDPNSLCTALQKIVERQPDWKDMSRNGREQIERYFNEPDINEKRHALYKQRTT